MPVIKNHEKVLIRTHSQIKEELQLEKYEFAQALYICNKYAKIWDEQKNQNLDKS